MNHAESLPKISEQEKQEEVGKRRTFLLAALRAFNERYPTNSKKRKIISGPNIQELRMLQDNKQSGNYNTPAWEDFYWNSLSDILQPFIQNWSDEVDTETGKTNLEKYLK